MAKRGRKQGSVLKKNIYRKWGDEWKFNEYQIKKLIKENPDKIKTKSDVLVLKRVVQSLTKGEDKNVSVERAWASYTNDQLLGMLSNTGFTLDQLAEMANTTVAEILDPSRWENDWTTFHNSKGQVFQFTFGYNAETVFEEVETSFTEDWT